MYDRISPCPAVDVMALAIARSAPVPDLTNHIMVAFLKDWGTAPTQGQHSSHPSYPNILRKPLVPSVRHLCLKFLVASKCMLTV